MRRFNVHIGFSRACIAALSLALAGCGAGSGHEEPAPVGLQPTLTSIQANIFTPTCAVSGCHAGANPVQGLNLEAGKSAANLINVASPYSATLFRVVPGDPDNSFLIQKLEPNVPIGDRMPLVGCCLQQVTIDVIRQWIQNGAPP